jgi:hypothetical protein
LVRAPSLYLGGSWFESKRADTFTLSFACYDFAMRKWLTLNTFMQIGLVGFTAGGFLLTSLKMPEYGLISNLVSEIFWLYASYRAWKEAKQYGVMITTLMITCILLYGVFNYWMQ